MCLLFGWNSIFIFFAHCATFVQMCDTMGGGGATRSGCKNLNIADNDALRACFEASPDSNKDICVHCKAFKVLVSSIYSLFRSFYALFCYLYVICTFVSGILEAFLEYLVYLRYTNTWYTIR